MIASPRVVVAAPSSGHGKTAVAVGLLAALRARGLRTAGFKIGPDLVDAAYLGLAAARPAGNLDPWLVGVERIAPLLAHGSAGADLSVIEGSMGLYDGLRGGERHPLAGTAPGRLAAVGDLGSTAHVSGLLRAPVVLVVDVSAMGRSVAALVHGFRSYDELVWLGGVILTRVVSDRHEQVLREALDDLGVPVFGALRRRVLPAGGLPARGHGVVPAVHRTVEATRAVRYLGEVVGDSVDLDRLLALARSAPSLVTEAWAAPVCDPPAGPPPRIALTTGYAYPETAELLGAAGAEVVGVDPLRDEVLPAGTAGLVVGGGLPEACLDEVAANTGLARSVAALAGTGAPVVAEGAGLAWMCREFDGRSMCGVVDATGRTGEHLVIGYREATVRSDSPHLSLGSRIVGYKQHVGLVSPRAGTQPAWSWPGGQPEGFVSGGVHASYLCLHWAGVPAVAERLVAAAIAARAGQPPSRPAGGEPGTSPAMRLAS